MSSNKLNKIALGVALSVGLSTATVAQETSSSMRGVIKGPEGNPAGNTKITVLHQPSGTVSEFVTNESGTFIAKGLRVGGPYTVVIDSDQFRDAMVEGVYLNLGETYRLQRQLESQDVETVVVTGRAMMMDTGGANSVFGEDVIDNVPSLNRDLKDVARLNPLASINGSGELSIAGGNPRTNSITVDGIGQNDDFGLNYGGYPTEQPPVSLDAIEQVSVSAAPFSAKKGDFSGGTINAVTKSGTNEFKGSVFYEFITPEMQGDVERIVRLIDEGGKATDENGFRVFDTEQVEPIEKESRFGLTLGGPIIEDELFFFTNYEEWKRELEMDYGFLGSDATHRYNTSRENFDRFLSILEDTYGFEDSLGGNPEDNDRKWLTKLSWNASDSHRLDITYQWQDNKDEREFGTGGDDVMLESRRYVYHTRMNNISARLYSDWSPSFVTEMGVSYKDVESQSLTRVGFGSVTVDEYYRGPSYEFGRDVYRHANASDNQNLKFNLDATWLLGEHEIKFGAEFERLRLYNMFVENSLGSWEFDSLDGFEEREVGNFRGNYDFSYANAYTNDPTDAAYDAVRHTMAFYAEDTFYASNYLELTAGLRYERLSSDDEPSLNQSFVDTYGFSNQENLDGLDILMPRVGFRYYASDDITVRGGIGRFYGGVPNVWYNNPFTKDGITLVSAPESVVNDYFANTSAPADFTQVPQTIRDSLMRGAGSTNYTDPNFDLPSDWRAQIGVDYSFDIAGIGNNFQLSSELLYMIKKDEPVWLNTAIEPVGTMTDGERLIQDSIYEGDLAENFDIMMTNAEEDGKSIIFTAKLAKEWDNGLHFTASYANQNIEENTPGSSSRAQSNYKHYIVKNRNHPFAGRGHYEVEHMFKLNLGYEKEFFSGYETSINLFFERRSGRPFSYTMGMYQDRDLGDTEDFYSNGAYLPYIPTGPNDPNVDWENSISWDELSTLLAQAGIEPGGYILGRNTETQPWVTELDLSVKQEIPGFVEGHKGTLFVTIDNLANLLNDDWGQERRLGFWNQNLYDFGGVSDDGRYQIDARFDGYDVRNYDQIDLNSSSWSIKLGVRYSF
ncbi:TonB-dependent receptor [Saliniradius amylolyticus]|uniref:TonB-dependent receptor n=1 Tax=Saliniradius amylolyticus TaxID=2183582 RepID=UPI000D6958EB|nr:TonB-dependent receptor [Saliniradius amylolyticus]